MTTVERVLAATSVADLDAYVAHGGGGAIAAVRDAAPDDVIELLQAAGLRGRGGAGFPTGRKWETVRDFAAGGADAPTVVVNGAEGEPGSFKDRSLLRRDPFRIVEGALVAAHAIGARRIVIALKETFVPELARVRDAVATIAAAGWSRDIELDVFAGPTSYLYGEETALLEVLDGRPPFPRVTPPFRRGVEDLPVPGDGEPGRGAAGVELAGPSPASVGVPTLVDNVETLAHVTEIVTMGADRFRELGTDESPGSLVCTVSGDAPRHGVGEFAMGTPLREVLTTVGDVDPDRVLAVMPGVSAAWLLADDLDVPLTYEAFAAAGSGLGTAGFIVVDRDADVLTVAAGVARFLAVESCGQCTPCKQDGRAIAAGLAALLDAPADSAPIRNEVDAALLTVGDEARCALAGQQQAAVGGALARLAPETTQSATARRTSAASETVAPIRDLVDGRFVLDIGELARQPDWTTDETDSGQAPADRLGSGAPAPRG
jgi:NADH:ubiquinone oxidoreductase subunit F (NADH-binding)